MSMIESLLIAAAIAFLAMPVVAIVAIVIAQRAIREIAALRLRLDRLEAGLASSTGTAPGLPVPEAGAPDMSGKPAAEAAPEAGSGPEAGSAPDAAPAATGLPLPDQAAGIRNAGKAGASIEERLGARWAVWVGALALALGGAFLVRFSLEQDLLGPGARTGVAGLFSLALLIGGEALRRRDFALALPGIGPGHVPAALTAAGAVSAFATVYAAFALYDLIAPVTAFLLLGMLGLSTMLAAALHGPLLAGLGLIGAFAVPVLTGGEGGQTWPLVPYFTVVTAAAHALAWLRGWRRVAIAATLIALAWVVLMLDGPAHAARLHLLIQTGLAVFVFAILPYRGTPPDRQMPDRGGRAVFAVALVVYAVALTALPDGAQAIYFPALMIAAMLVAGAMPALSAAGVAALGVLLVTLYLWPVAREALAEPTRLMPGPAGDLPWPEAFRRFIAFAIIATLAVVALGFRRLIDMRSMPRRITMDYAILFAAAPAAVLMVVYWRLTGAARLLEGVAEPAFAVAAALLASAYTLFATRLRGRSGEMAPAGALVCGLCAVAALANLALALAFWLDRGMLTVALALAGAGAAFVAQRTGLSLLRYGVGALAVIVALRLAWDPGIVDGDPGRTLIINWLLWGYGVPAIAFLAAAHWLSRDGRDAMARLSEALGIVFAVFLVFFQLRHALHGGVMPARFGGLLDAGLAVLTVLCAALILLRVDTQRPDAITRIGARLFGLIALVLSGAGLVLGVNPLLTDAPVAGGPLLNALLPAYLLPALLAASIAVMLRHEGRRNPAGSVEEAARSGQAEDAKATEAPAPAKPRRFSIDPLCRLQFHAMAGLAFLLQAIWSVAAIRMAFQGPRIGLGNATGETELWAYSAMLLLAGLAALVVGLWRNLGWLRLIAAGYLLVAAIKVFLVDLAGLGGPIRAASFIALGLVLVGIGLLYQWLLQRPQRVAPIQAPPEG